MHEKEIKEAVNEAVNDSQNPETKPVEPKPVEEKPKEERISIEEFARVDLRSARILEAEKVAGSKKLIRMIIEIGDEKRQIVAGIGRKYSPESLLGKKIIVVANLQPARLMGLESNGMLLAATSGEDPILAGFDEDVPSGIRLK
jgi:methionyl-tRNA synthetase